MNFYFKHWKTQLGRPMKYFSSVGGEKKTNREKNVLKLEGGFRLFYRCKRFGTPQLFKKWQERKMSVAILPGFPSF